MSDNIIRIEARDVRKKFTLRQTRSSDLRERFMAWRAPKKDAPLQELWALKGVSFDLLPGRALGIVGHNGSGKSTLLKMLTGILKPTSGDVHIHGRVGALIEVGAGFHPDLTGRENIFLNGSILGLSRQEITRKFDDIVSFANLEKFIDTPVKRYSSGMYMRLGFAVAAHTSPDILLIDEVLAVGDAFFQRKCIRHLTEFINKGGSVVFVSHAMNQVSEICDTCLWLDHGEMRYFGPTQDAIDQYMAVVAEREEEEFKRRHPEEWAAREAERRRIEEEAREIDTIQKEETDRVAEEEETRRQAWLNDPRRGRFTGVTLRDSHGRERTSYNIDEPLSIEIAYRFGRPLPRPVFCLEIFRDDGLYMFATNSLLHDLNTSGLPLEGTVRLSIPNLSLNAGEYRIDLSLFPDGVDSEFYRRFQIEDKREEAVCFRVRPGAVGGYGCAYIPVKWQVGTSDDNTSGEPVPAVTRARGK